MARIFCFLVALALASGAAAHGPAKGANGGPQVDAGDYHVEMVAKKRALDVYLRDTDDKPVEAKGHKAVGIFVVGGKAQRIELTPEAGNKLSGTSPVALPAALKGAVQITLPDGKTVQAKFD